MTKVVERCGCGASIEVQSESGSRASSLLDQWRKEHQHTHTTPSSAPEPQPEGNNFSATHLREQTDRNHELNSNDRPGHYGRSISLKWHPQEAN